MPGKVFELTKGQLLPRVRGESEVKHRHGGYEQARHDQVVEVVQSSPPQLDHEGDVKIRLRAAVVDNRVGASGDAFKKQYYVTMTLQQQRSQVAIMILHLTRFCHAPTTTE